jgi:hypothetical protein
MYRTIYKVTKLTNHQNHTDQVCFFLNKFSITKFHRKTEIDLCMTIKKKSDPAIFNQKIWYKTTT